jgi:hypothetical protein
MSDGGKGDSQRPTNIKAYDEGHTRIFGESRLEKKKREEALTAMVRENEKLGLYDNTENPLIKK